MCLNNVCGGHVISAEELGNIISRLAITDETVQQKLLAAVCATEQGLLPDDAGKLREWILFVQAMRHVTQAPRSPQIFAVRLHDQ